MQDHSSNRNIIWATDNYSSRGYGYCFHDEITISAITGYNGSVIKPRVEKSQKEQAERIKQKAEVFTPPHGFVISKIILLITHGLILKIFLMLSISISVSDMKNYEKKLKILYFVVMLKDEDYKIYYKPLLLWDINRFLIDSQGQDSLTTVFEELPLGSADEVKNILLNFIHESENQKQMIPGVASMEQLMEKIPNGKTTFHINVPASFNGNDVLFAISKAISALLFVKV